MCMGFIIWQTRWGVLSQHDPGLGLIHRERFSGGIVMAFT